MAIIIKPPVSGGGGGGAVDSVNGQTGAVVLTTDNIDAGSNADKQYWTSTLQTSLDAKATDADLTTLDGRVDVVESDITSLDGRVDTAETDIASLEANRLYSNSFYVNDGVNDIQTVHDDASFGQGDTIFVSSGSYGGSTLSLTKSNFLILPPPGGIGDICELAGGRGLTISGNDCTRIRIRSLQVEGNTLINGTQGRHLFKDVTFLGTTTITNSTANFITFEDCEFAGTVTIASSVTATIYFNRCSFGGVAIASSLVNPLQCILVDCSGINASQVNLVGLVFAGRTAFANNTVSQYASNSKYVYNLLTGATTSFSGSYSELRDQPTIPSAYTDEMARDAAGTALANGSHTGISFVNSDAQDRIDATVSLASFDTDDLSEGATNKYFSDTLARGAFTAGTGISITTGTIASTITQYTDADADARITAQKGQNNGLCELDANGLVPTNHLPPLAITDVHVVADATERLALVAQEGDVAIQTDNSTSWIYSGTAWVQFTSGAGGVTSVNGQTGTVSLTTTDIAEGTNLYYTTTRFDDRLALKTTDNLTEGSTNKYFSSSLAKTAAVVNSMAGTQTDQAPSVSSVKSYYTAGTGISLSSGTIASTITQYTDTLAKTAAVVNSLAGTQTDQAPSVSSVNTALSSIQANIGASGALVYKGEYDATANSPSLTTAKKGFFYQVSVSGALAGVSLTTTDQIVFVADVAGGTVQSTDFIVIDNTESTLAGGGLTISNVVNGATMQSGVYHLYDGSGNISINVPAFGVNPNVGAVAYLRIRGTGQVTLTASGVAGGEFIVYADSGFSNGVKSVVLTKAGEYKLVCTRRPKSGTVYAQWDVTASNDRALRSTTDLAEGTNLYFTDERAQDQAASIFTGGTHTGISYSYIDASNRIDSTVSLSGFSIDALSDVDTTTASPTNGQALAWQSSSSKWIPQTISGGGGGSRVAITEKTTSFQITDPVDASIIQEHYAMNSSSSTTFTLPTAVGNNGLSYIITRVGTGAVSVATVSAQTISGLSSLSITSQWSSVTVKSNGTNWIIY